MGKNGIIFDLDGTLWETIESNYNALLEVIKKYNLKPVSKQMLCDNYGNSKKQSAAFLFPDLNEEKAFAVLEEIDDITIKNLEINGAYIYPGLEEALFNLHEKYSLYIVSNAATKKYVEAFLTSSKLFKYFEDYYAASEMKLTKAEAIKKIIEDNNIDKAIYVGDTLNDLNAAKEANIPFIDCLYGFGKELDTKYKIKDVSMLNEVADIIMMGGINGD